MTKRIKTNVKAVPVSGDNTWITSPEMLKFAAAASPGYADQRCISLPLNNINQGLDVEAVVFATNMIGFVCRTLST